MTNPHDIIGACARFWNISRGELLGRNKRRSHSLPRQVAMYLMLESGMTSIDVGRFIGRDHSTVMHGRDSVKGWMQNDLWLRGVVATLKAETSKKKERIKQ